MRSRKIFVMAVIMLSLITAGLWAQEFKFDGYLNSGLGIVTNDNEDTDPYWKAFGVDGESNGYRFRLNGSYTNETKNAGARFRLQSQRNLTIPVNSTGTASAGTPPGDHTHDVTTSGTNTYGYFSMPYAYGWMSFFENMITLTGGIVDDSTWQTADWWFNEDGGEGLGLLLKAEPVKGLNLGVGVYTISQQSGGSNNILTVGGNLPNFGAATPKLDQAKYTFNAAYTMPDTFRLGAVFRPKNRAAWVGSSAANIIAADDDNYANSGNYECSELIGELRILAVKNLTAVVVGVFDYLDDFDKKGNIILSETFGYKLDSLNLGLNAVQFLYNRTDANDDKVEYNPGMLFNPWVSYTIDKLVPRLDLVYFMGGRSKMSNGTNQWERRGFANAAKVKDAEDDYSVFSIRPSVKFNLDGRTFLEIGDMINLDSAVKDGAYADKGDAKKNSLFSNVFYVDLKFSF
jgi:hypothetical protein